MTVKQLIEMLGEANPSAKVSAVDIYDEGVFTITGMEHTTTAVSLTGESLD